MNLEDFRDDEDVVMAVFANAENAEHSELHAISQKLLNDRSFLLRFLQEGENISAKVIETQEFTEDNQRLNIFLYVTDKTILQDKNFIKQVVLITGNPSVLRYIHPLLATDKEMFSFVLSHTKSGFNRAFTFLNLKDLRTELLDNEGLKDVVNKSREEIYHDIPLLRKLYAGEFGHKNCIQDYISIKICHYIPEEAINAFEFNLKQNPLPKEFYVNQIDDVAEQFKNNNLGIGTLGTFVDAACYLLKCLNDKDLEQIKRNYSVKDYSSFSSFANIEQTRRLQMSSKQTKSSVDDNKRSKRKIGR